MKVSIATLIALCCAPLAGAQASGDYKPTQPVGSPPVTITGVGATMAHAPEAVTIRGTGLGMVVHVRVNDVSAQILDRTLNSRVVLPQAADPGSAVVEAFSPVGNARGAMDYLPALRAHANQGTLTVNLNPGEPGQYWIYYATNIRKEPVFMPGMHYGSMIFMSSHPTGLVTTGYSDGSPVAFSMAIPPWTPYPMYYQAVCLFRDADCHFGSFSNLAMVEWEPKLTDEGTIDVPLVTD